MWARRTWISVPILVRKRNRTIRAFSYDATSFRGLIIQVIVLGIIGPGDVIIRGGKENGGAQEAIWRRPQPKWSPLVSNFSKCIRPFSVADMRVVGQPESELRNFLQ